MRTGEGVLNQHLRALSLSNARFKLATLPFDEAGELTTELTTQRPLGYAPGGRIRNVARAAVRVPRPRFSGVRKFSAISVTCP